MDDPIQKISGVLAFLDWNEYTVLAFLMSVNLLILWFIWRNKVYSKRIYEQLLIQNRYFLATPKATRTALEKPSLEKTAPESKAREAPTKERAFNKTW